MRLMTEVLQAPRAELADAYRIFFASKAAFRGKTRTARGVPARLTAR